MISFLNNKSIGIDIADRSVEVVEIEKNGDGLSLISCGRAELEPGIVNRGEIVDEGKLKMAVEEAMAKASPKPIVAKTAVFGLPEGKVYPHIFELPIKRKKSLEASVEEEMNSSLPIDWDDLAFSYKVIGEAVPDKKGERILSIAASRKTIQSWQAFFSKLGIGISLFDEELMATHRGVKIENRPGGVCIVDIGSVNTIIGIFNEKGMFYSYSFKCGGDEFTREIAEHWKKADGSKTDLAEAEKIKIEHGITECQGDNKDVCQILKNTARPIIEEVKNGMKIYAERTGSAVGQVILTGGSANMKGLQNYFFESITPVSKPAITETDQKKEAQPAEFVDVKIGEPLIKSGSAPLYFIEAIGLARRAFSGPWEKTDPVLDAIVEAKQKKSAPVLTQKNTAGANEQDEGRTSWIKDHPKEIQLAVVLILGVVLVAGAFWYRQSSAQKRLNAMKTKNANPYTYQASFLFSVPVNTSTGVLKTGEIRGRVVTKKIDKAASMEEAVMASKTEAEKELRKGEVLWKDAISKIDEKKKIVFPISTSWLVYSESDSAGAYLDEIKKQLNGKADFILKTVDLDRVEHQGTSTIYMLFGRANVMATKKVEGTASSTEVIEEGTPPVAATAQAEKTEESPATTTSPSVEEKDVEIKSIEDLMTALKAAKSMVLITNTPEGWTNVRVSASDDSAIVKKANDGEKYKFIEEKEGWIKIRLSDTEEGWVITKHAQRTAP